MAPRRELAGHIGVDRARIILCDPSYMGSQQLEGRDREIEDEQLAALSHQQWRASRRGEEVDVRSIYPLYYQIPFLRGHQGAAVVVRSGVGDGFYPVYVTIDEVEGFGERVVKVEVDFLEDPFIEKEEPV